MAQLLIVKSASEIMTLEGEMGEKLYVRYLTLTDNNKKSENLYYFSVRGKDAEIEWHEGDCIMVELSFLAYQHGGQWHMGNRLNTLDLIEVGVVGKNLKPQENG